MEIRRCTARQRVRTEFKDGEPPQTGLRENFRNGVVKKSWRWSKEKVHDVLDEGVNKYVSSGSSGCAISPT